jgi:hypothetical protein
VKCISYVAPHYALFSSLLQPVDEGDNRRNESATFAVTLGEDGNVRKYLMRFSVDDCGGHPQKIDNEIYRKEHVGKK